MSIQTAGQALNNELGGFVSPFTGFRNAVINGNFAINQRAVTGTVTLAAGAYGHDRFKAGAGGCTYTFATSQNVTTLTITAGTLIQVIEGANLLTDTYTLTFTGTAQGKIGAGSFGASGITGSVTGGTNLNVEFNTGTVSLVQLERGSVATPFEFRSIGQELGLCQRYYVNNFSSVSGSYHSTSTGFITVPLPVYMRAAPTISLSSGTSLSIDVPGIVATSFNAPQFGGIKVRQFRIGGTLANAASIGMTIVLSSNTVQASAEL